MEEGTEIKSYAYGESAGWLHFSGMAAIALGLARSDFDGLDGRN
jgi:hypothetical protein